MGDEALEIALGEPTERSTHGHRISWLDSAQMASRIHRTVDGAQTCCAHPFAAKAAHGEWQLARVPLARGFCRRCFAGTKKADVLWLSTLPTTELAEGEHHIRVLVEADHA